MTEPVRYGLDDFNDVYYDGPLDELPSENGSMPVSIVTVHEFADTDEPGAQPLVGENDDILIPQNGDVMLYGDGGAGKTTLAIDLAFHAAAADDWLNITIDQPLRVLLIENEGPRPLFRRKLRTKRDGWQGLPVDDRILVLETPWAELKLDNEQARTTIAHAVRDHSVDLLIAGPLTRLGMNDAGTLQEVVAFMALVADVRHQTGRHVTVILIHHENKGGQVSGAWEGAGDTLLHVQGQGHGRTRVYIQKARWDSKRHGTTFNLIWTDGHGFELEERPDITPDTMADAIIAAARQLPGASWTKIRDLKIDGVKVVRGTLDELATVRDRLIASGQLINYPTVKGQFALWAGDDPTAPSPHEQTRSESRTASERDPFGQSGANPLVEGRSPVRALIRTGNGTERVAPDTERPGEPPELEWR